MASPEEKEPQEEGPSSQRPWESLYPSTSLLAPPPLHPQSPQFPPRLRRHYSSNSMMAMAHQQSPSYLINMDKPSPSTNNEEDLHHHHHRTRTSSGEDLFIPEEIEGDLLNNYSYNKLGGAGGKNSSSSARKKVKTTRPFAQRLVRKSGGVNVKVVNVEDKGERYVGDFFTTLVDVRWRWTLTYFTISYVLSWLLFAFIWWVIVRGHGDMDHFEEEGWRPCVVGVNSFASIFLFSLETQHTIGYGYHRMSDECGEAIFLLVVQSIIGVIIESLTVGVFIVKLSRSKKRAQTVVFSKVAVICKKEKGLALAFRVADVGKSMLLEAHIRAQWISKSLTKSGKVLLTQQAINLEAEDQDEDRLLLFWPTTIYHELEEESPLYSLSPQTLKESSNDSKFELVVVLEGIVESTGMTTQARTSFLPSEILWGEEFLPLLHQGGKYTVDMEVFHTTFPVQGMGDKCAKELDEEEEGREETLESV